MIEACSASGGRSNIQRGTRRGTSSSLSFDDDPHDLKVVLEEVGNDECILHEETELGTGTPFGGA